jgi:uncharacterized cupredoxin-like copper-binding protein
VADTDMADTDRRGAAGTMKRLRTVAVLAIIAAGVVVAVRYGGSSTTAVDSMQDGSASMPKNRGPVAATRTIEVSMVDLAFSPDHVQVTSGTTARFVFHNRGHLTHEAFIGDAAAQEAHDQEMSHMPGKGDRRDSQMLTVPPGGSGELAHTFDRAGTMLVGCHMPGHYNAGMKLTIVVV